MITREIFETIEGLNRTYFEKWGYAVDYSATTKNISPENLLIAPELPLIVDSELSLYEEKDSAPVPETLFIAEQVDPAELETY